MFCEPYLYVTSLENLYLYVWYANYVIKDYLETMTRGPGRRPGPGYRVGALNLHLSTCIYAWSNYWWKNPKQCVRNVCQNNFDVLWESICNSRGIAGTDFSSSGSLLDKQLGKPLVFYPALLQWLKIKVPSLQGRRKGEIPVVLPLSSALLLKYIYILSKNKTYPGNSFHAWVNRG